MSKQTMAKFVHDAKLAIKKHTPEILTGIGIAGMLATTVLAVQATPKALRLIEEEKKRQNNIVKLPPIDIVKTTWKCYVPAAALGVASSACLIGANSIHLKRGAALAAAYKLSETALTEYRAKVLETIGEKKEEIIRDKVNQERLEKVQTTPTEVIITKKGDTLFLDPLSKRVFRSDIEKIRKAENVLNKNMLQDMFGYVSLNDFYNEIGLEETDIGDVIGWNVGRKIIDIHFSPGITKDEEPCLVLDYVSRPEHGFDRFS